MFTFLPLNLVLNNVNCIIMNIRMFKIWIYLIFQLSLINLYAQKTLNIIKLDSQRIVVLNGQCEYKYYSAIYGSWQDYHNIVNLSFNKEMVNFHKSPDDLITESNNSKYREAPIYSLLFTLIDSTTKIKKFRNKKTPLNCYTIKIQMNDTFIILKNLYSSFSYKRIKDQLKFSCHFNESENRRIIVIIFKNYIISKKGDEAWEFREHFFLCDI